MNEQLSTLIELQEIDTIIGALKTKLAAIPARIDLLRSGYQHEQSVEKDLAVRLEQLRHDHRQSSRELDDQEARIKKVKDQELMIKSNKEFEVFKHELQGLVQKRDEIEDVILTAMERTDEAEKALRAHAAVIEKARSVFTVEEKRLLAEQAELQEELARRETIREGISGRLSEGNRRAVPPAARSLSGAGRHPRPERHLPGVPPGIAAPAIPGRQAQRPDPYLRPVQANPLP